MDILIVEDEKHAALRLEKQLKQCNSSINIKAILSSVSEAIHWIKNNPAPDLAFFDIQLEDGLSFEIFDNVDFITPIIFTTAYDSFMVNAFKVNSIDYLLKPISSEDLINALNKFNNISDYYNYKTDKINQLLEAIKQPDNSVKRRFMISYGDKIKSVPVKDIAYFYSDEGITYLVTFDNQHYPLEYSIDTLEIHTDCKEFFRINRQFLISSTAIETIYSYPKGRYKVKLRPDSDKDTFVSWRRGFEFKTWLNS
jgi:DNA-binding LytR/AlgR family response regulator